MRQQLATDRLRAAAVVWVAAARVGLWVLPLAWNRRLAAIASKTKAPYSGNRMSPAAVGEAVRAARRAVPRASCLVQALAAAILLRRAGLPAVLYLGSRGPREGALLAHAWVESNGFVVVGGDVSSQLMLARFDLVEDPSWASTSALES